MKTILSILLFFLFSSSYADDSVVIEGVFSWNESHFAEVTECKSHKKFKFGTMASTPYFQLTQEIEKLQINGPILIRVSGKVVNEDENQIEHPLVLSIKNGNCK